MQLRNYLVPELIICPQLRSSQHGDVVDHVHRLEAVEGAWGPDHPEPGRVSRDPRIISRLIAFLPARNHSGGIKSAAQGRHHSPHWLHGAWHHRPRDKQARPGKHMHMHNTVVYVNIGFQSRPASCIH
jgi:hypothetical protein